MTPNQIIRPPVTVEPMVLPPFEMRQIRVMLGGMRRRARGYTTAVVKKTAKPRRPARRNNARRRPQARRVRPASRSRGKPEPPRRRNAPGGVNG